MRLSALAVVFLVPVASAQVSHSKAAAPVHVTVVARAPLQTSDANLFREITQSYVNRYSHTGQPLTLTVTLGQGAVMMRGRDAAMMGGYWEIERYGWGVPNHPAAFGPVAGGTHNVPLAGGTMPNVGFQPVSGTSETPAGGTVPVVFSSGIVARYTITDPSGKVLETDTVPLMEPTTAPFAATHLRNYHDAGMYIAGRVAKVR